MDGRENLPAICKTFMTQCRMGKQSEECKPFSSESTHLTVMDGLTEYVADISMKTDRHAMRGLEEEKLPFGCQVLHRVSGKLVGGTVAPRVAARNVAGTWSYDEHMVGTESGEVMRARCARRMVVESSRNAKRFRFFFGQH